MDEQSMKESLELYKTQLSQVTQMIQAAGGTDDLVKLQSDLTELINLTQDSLLSLKKSQLLASLEETTSSPQPSTAAPPTGADDEYAAFQAALGSDAFDLPTETCATSGNQNIRTDNTRSNDNPSTASKEVDGNTSLTSIADSFEDLVGMKCRAPFSHDWGGLSYHNALVYKVEGSDALDEIPKVRVMFCNPTHVSMLPCKFYLDGRCRFPEEKCKYSHGYLVNLEDLVEYKEPDYSLVKVGGRCFARYSDEVWHPATIVDVDDTEVSVTFTSHGNTEVVELHEILPLEAHDDDSSQSEASDLSDEDTPSTSTQPINREESDSEDELPVFLWRPPKTTALLGEWEQHTKGFGSRLMAKMGYVTGQGLGVRGEGRAEPVPIQLLPQGKSLDKIMELKEIAGDRDLFDAMKKLKKKKKKMETKSTTSTTSEPRPNVFDFINKKLRGKKGNLNDLVSHQQPGGKKPEPQRHIAESDLRQKSDRHLNIQALKTSEEIRKVEKELQQLRVRLARNVDKDKGMTKHLQQKITSTEAYLDKLKSSEMVLEKHKQKRSDHKKLTIF